MSQVRKCDNVDCARKIIDVYFYEVRPHTVTDEYPTQLDFCSIACLIAWAERQQIQMGKR